MMSERRRGREEKNFYHKRKIKKKGKMECNSNIKKRATATMKEDRESVMKKGRRINKSVKNKICGLKLRAMTKLSDITEAT